MTTEHNHVLNPAATDPAALDPTMYHRVVAPALKVSAEAAAKRGDPTLHADMPAMLALVDIVTHLAGLYGETYPDNPIDRAMLDGAPASACVMVLQEAGLDPQATGQCLAALETAYGQISELDVIGEARPYIAMAWEHLIDDQSDQADACLTQATHTIIAAIESWQAQVH